MQQFRENIENNDFKACFFAMNTKGQYHETMEYIYDIALAYEKAGIETYLIHEETDYKMPEWLGEEYTNLTHYSFEDFSGKITLSASDYIFVPEAYTELLSQLVEHKVPAEIVMIIQHYEMVFDALELGDSYSTSYGIKNVIVPSNAVKNHLSQYMNGLNFHVLNPYVKNVFEQNEKPKKPIVLMADSSSRASERIVKKFYTKYPQYSWVPFKMLSRFHINDIKDQYQEAPCAIFLDDKNSFCIEQLQAMSMGVVPISATPKLAPDWLIEDGKLKNLGVYTNNDLKIVDLIAYFIDAFITDRVEEDIITLAKQTASGYNSKRYQEQFSLIFENLKQSRLDLFNRIEQKQKENKLQKVEN